MPCGPVVMIRGATTVSKLGVQFLGLGYYYLSTEKSRQVYRVWCSRLHNHTLFIKKLCEKLGVLPNFGEVRTPDPPMVVPTVITNKHDDNHTVMRASSVHQSVCPTLSRKHRLRNENGKCATGCGSGTEAQPRLQSWGSNFLV